MRSALRRLQIVAMISFFPLAIMGLIRQRTSLREAVRLYNIAILMLTIFLVLLAIYTYTRGGNFIPPIGTFY